MQRRDRLMATLRGETVDRPPISFYELTGLDEDINDPDPFNIYNHPSWAPLLELAREKTDRIVLRTVPWAGVTTNPGEELGTTETSYENGSRFERRTIQAGQRTLTELTRRDPDVNTVWVIEHLLKNVDDLAAYLSMPAPALGREIDTSGVLQAEAALGDSGIVLIDTPDPLCMAASLFHMEEYTIIALTEQKLFHQLLERLAALLYPQIEAIAQALPGHLWRIFGPEYASPPYLPPRLFGEYVVRYDTFMVEAIQRHGGYARIHSHGRLRHILDDIAATGCTALDPIEPPPQGDVELQYVRERYGKQMVLFGNIEASDIEMLPTVEFEKKVIRALKEGTMGEGRGFVLMPSACPYGRVLSSLALSNYEKMVELVERF